MKLEVEAGRYEQIPLKRRRAEERICNGSRVHIIYSQSHAIIEALEGIIYSRRAESQTMNIETSAWFFL
jgi:hypothetical protein